MRALPIPHQVTLLPFPKLLSLVSGLQLGTLRIEQFSFYLGFRKALLKVKNFVYRHVFGKGKGFKTNFNFLKLA
jgi:hypothetical protein